MVGTVLGEIMVARMRRIAGLALLMLMLAACASTQTRGRPHASMVPGAGEPTGWLVLSLGSRYEEGKLAPFQNHGLTYRAASGSDEDSGWIDVRNDDFKSPDPTKLDIVEGTTAQIVVVVALRPGQYLFTGGWMGTDIGVASQSVESAKGYTQAFEIRDGAITYAGSYLGHVIMGENALGMDIRAGAYYQVRDQRERDLAIARRRQPQLPADAPVIDAIPRSAKMAGGMFNFEP